MTEFATLDDLDVAGKRVLLRADLNVPMQDGKVTDTTRIDRVSPTIKELADKGAKIVILSHFGRPKGEKKPEMSLEPILPALIRATGLSIGFGKDCVGDEAVAAVSTLSDGEAVLLENLRYFKGEEKNDPAFVAELAKLGDVYVNDAFSTAHRAHASTEGLAHHMPSAAGRLMQAELEALTKGLEAPERPLMAVVGGAKISTKLDLLLNLVSKVNLLVLGGGMANTFLHADGVDLGKSLAEKDMAEQAREIKRKAEETKCRIMLPVDGVVAREFKAGAPSQITQIHAVPSDGMVLDIGPKSIEAIKQAVDDCKTVVWNGPLGAFEISPFDTGTTEVARHVAALTKAGNLRSVAGGGDTVAALAKAAAEEDFSYVSTAGGAFLEWLEGKDLPGVAALRKKQTS